MAENPFLLFENYKKAGIKQFTKNKSLMRSSFEVNVLDRLYWLGVQTIMPGWGRRAWSMIRYFGTARDFWMAPESEILSYPSGSRKARERLVLRRNSLDLAKEEEKIKRAGITYVTIKDKNYPEDLKFIHDPPPAIFVRGNIEIKGYTIAIVGSRKATPYGLMVAETLSRDLARAGLVVVSGLARGVDTAAHRGTLAVNGKTIAVLGCGLNVAYPKENRGLMDDIVANGGAVISEFPLGSRPEAWHFPVRNRVISGLSKGVLVVEAKKRSGALITADQALEQGKDVLAVPGSVHSALSQGPHRLIKEGAKLVENAGDVMEEICGCGLFDDVGNNKGMIGLNSEEEKIYQAMTGEPITLDEITRLTEIPLQKVMSALMFLEMKKLVKKFPGGKYAAFKS